MTSINHLKKSLFFLLAFFLLLASVSALTPIDPFFSQQWGFESSQDIADIDATSAWDVTTGSDEVIIAVLGTGVDLDHIDLKNNIWVNPGEIAGNGLDDDGNGYVDDVHGYDFFSDDSYPEDTHGIGTAAAGVAAAESNNRGSEPGSVDLRVLDELYKGIEILPTGEVFLTVPGDNRVYLSFMTSLSSREFLFTAPVADPEGITYDGSHFWLTDSTTDRIYELAFNSLPVSASKVRLTVIDSPGLEGDEVVRMTEIELFENGVNIAPEAVLTSSYLGWGGFYASYLNDGNFDTDFIGADGADPITIVLDFGSLRSLDSITLHSRFKPPVEMTLEYFDGSSWVLSNEVSGGVNEVWNDFFNKEYFVVSSFSSPGSSPKGLDFDGSNLWLADGASVYKLSTSGTVLESYTLPEPVWGVAYNPDTNSVWVSGTTSLFEVEPGVGLINVFEPMYVLYNQTAPSQPLGMDFFNERLYGLDNYFEETSTFLNMIFNTLGVASACWDCKIMPLRVVDNPERDPVGSYDALRYARDNGADIVLAAFHTYHPVDEFAFKANTLPIYAPAGNSPNKWKAYPAAFDQVTAVGGVNRYGYFSSYAWNDAVSDRWVDIIAPYQNIKTTALNSQFVDKSSTILSAAFVAGTAGLVLSEGLDHRVVLAAVKEHDSGIGILNAYKSLTEDPARVVLRSVDINDRNDDYLQAGEQVEISFTIKNLGSSPLLDAKAYLSLSNASASVISYLGDVAAHQSAQAVFTVTADEAVSVISGDLRVTSNNADDIYLPVMVYTSPVIRYDVELPGSESIFHLVPADMTGDGQDEVVIVSDNRFLSDTEKAYVHIFKDGVELSYDHWPKEIGESARSKPVITNLDADSQLEIVVVGGYSAGNILWVFDHDGSLLFSKFTPNAFTSLTVADLDGDGSLEIVVEEENYDFSYPQSTLYAWHLDGTLMSGFPLLFDSSFIVSNFVVFDSDNDFADELFFLLEDGTLFAYGATNFPVSLNSYFDYSVLLAGDIDLDGDHEIVVSSSNSLKIVSHTGVVSTLLSGCDVFENDFSSLSFGQMDDDPELEIVYGCSGEYVYEDRYYAGAEIFVLNHDGSLLNDCWPKKIHFFSSYGQSLIADKKFFFNKWDSNQLGSMDAFCQEEYVLSDSDHIAFADVDNNGFYELIVASNRLTTLDLSAEVSFPMNGLNPANSYNYDYVDPVDRCDDGVAYGVCSPHLPKFCDDGVVIDNCQQCKCPSSMTCSESGACVADSNPDIKPRIYPVIVK